MTTSPQPPLALRWWKLFKDLSLIVAQKSFVVVVIVLSVVMLQVAERFFLMDTRLPLCGFAATEDDAEQETGE